MNTISKISDIKTGWGYLISSEGLLPEEIQKLQSIRYGKDAGEWNHAGNFQWCADDQLWCVEMEKEGLVKNLFDEYLAKQQQGKCDILILKPKFEYNPFRAVTLIEENVGKIRYEFKNLFIYQLIKMKTGKFIGARGKRAAKRMICGEWVAYYYYMLTNYPEFKKWYEECPAECYLNDLFEHFLWRPNI